LVFGSYEGTTRCFIEWDELHRTQVISRVLTRPLSSPFPSSLPCVRGIPAQGTALLSGERLLTASCYARYTLLCIRIYLILYALEGGGLWFTTPRDLYLLLWDWNDQLNLVHGITPCLYKIYFNIIFLPVLRASKWSPSVIFLHWNSGCNSLKSHFPMRPFVLPVTVLPATVLFRNVVRGAGENWLYCHFNSGMLEPILVLYLWCYFVPSSIILVICHWVPAPVSLTTSVDRNYSWQAGSP
jgi:hypothetical protein